jgi:hypothetical protein
MKTEHGKIGDTILNDKLILHGMCTGHLIVEAGGTLYLHGMCTGPLEVRAGGVAYIYGTCTKSVTNNGGSLEVFGTVNGVLDTVSGVTRVDPKAIVNRAF